MTVQPASRDALPARVVILWAALGVLGWQLGHELVYRLVDPHIAQVGTGGDHAHAGVATTSGAAAAHGYVEPVGILAIGVTLFALLGVAHWAWSRRLGARAGHTHRPLPSAACQAVAVVLPVPVFVLAELAEHSAAGFAPPLALLAAGSAVQAVFGLLALAVLRMLVAGLVDFVCALRAWPLELLRGPLAASLAPGHTARRPLDVMATALAGRAPPRPHSC